MDSNNMSIYGAGQDCSTDVEGNGGSEVFVQAFDDAYQNRTVGTHDSGSANLTRPPNNCASFEHDDLERKSPQATLQSFPTPPNFPPPNSDFTQSFPTLPDSQPPDSNFTQSLEEPNAPVSSCANDSGGFTSRYFLSTEDDVGEIAPVLHNLFSPDESGMDDPGPISDAEQPLGIPDAAWQNVEPQRSHDGVEALMIQPDAQQSLGIPDAARQNVEPQRSHDGLEAFMVQPNVYPQATTGANTEIHGCHPGVNTSITEHPPRSPSEVPNSLSLDSTTRISQISPSAIAKKSTGKRKLDLDCATAFFETAKLMQCATNGQSEKRGFLNSFNQFLTRPCAESASLSQDQYRMKALCFLGERPTREVSRKQVLAKFTSEACIEAELARSFPWSEQDGFSFGPITTYLWNKIQLAQQKVQPVQKARRAQVEEKCTHEAQKTKRSWFERGSYWSEPAKQCLVDLLFKSHRQHSMTVSQIADASYWFLTKFHVEVLIYSRCACPDCILWGMYDKQCTPGELVLEYSRLQFEVYYTLLLAHKYDDPMLVEWYPQLGALSERERKLLLEKLHDCDTCPQCLSSRKSARTRCNSTSSEFTDDGYGDDHEDKNEDEDLMDEGTRIQRVTADVAAAVAHTLFPQSEDFFDAEDYDEVDEDDEKSKNDEDAISLSLGRLALNNQ